MIDYAISSSALFELKDLRNLKLFDKDGYLDSYDSKFFIFPNDVKVVSNDTLEYLLAVMRGERDEALLELRSIQKLKMKIGKLESQLKRYKEENVDLKKSIKEFDNTYGKYISPFTIVDELYRGLNAPYRILNPRLKFKIKISPKQFDYWTGIFLDLKMIRRIDKGKLQSLMYWEDAHNLLYENDYTWNGEDNEKRRDRLSA